MIDLFAIFSMVINHIGIIFLEAGTPLYAFSRCMGRLMLPLLAYRVAHTYVHTKNLTNYFYLLISMSLASQLPYLWMQLGTDFTTEVLATRGGILITRWNLGFTFMIALFIIYLSQHIVGNQFFTFVLFALVLILSSYGKYDFYGVLMVVIFYHYVKGNIPYIICCFLVANITLLSIFLVPIEQRPLVTIYQVYSLVSLVIIGFARNKTSKLSKYFIYYFYPIHMFILCLLAYGINSI